MLSIITEHGPLTLKPSAVLRHFPCKEKSVFALDHQVQLAVAINIADSSGRTDFVSRRCILREPGKKKAVGVICEQPAALIPEIDGSEQDFLFAVTVYIGNQRITIENRLSERLPRYDYRPTGRRGAVSP